MKIRDSEGTALAPGEVARCCVRGPQVSGTYLGIRVGAGAEGVVPDQGRGPSRHRRLPLHQRPCGRHHHPRRREHRPVGKSRTAPLSTDVRKVVVVGLDDAEVGSRSSWRRSWLSPAPRRPEQLRLRRSTLRESCTLDRIAFREKLLYHADRKGAAPTRSSPTSKRWLPST